MPYQTIKGTYDLLPDRYIKSEYIEEIFKHYLALYGFHLMKTPVLEYAAVFRKDNDTSDMVTKEMYTFSVNGKDLLTLRPEGTAGIIRSFIENKIYGKEELPYKVAYIEEMFRHERPQKGRQRQFTQLGLECIGSKSPYLDSEVIALGYNYIKALGLNNIEVLVNTLGDTESRIVYSNALKDYFEPHLAELCSDCKNRYYKNPLRILDCKVDHRQSFMQDAPVLNSYLSAQSKLYFSELLACLDILNIPYRIDNKLVRGLDYYTDTVFEVVSTGEKAGAQATLFAGGRYDSLVQELGGPALSGIGFAIGEERLLLALEEENLLPAFENSLDIYICNLNNSVYVLKIAEMLRNADYTVECNYIERSLKAQFKSADKKNAKFVFIIGEDEEKNNTITIRNSTTKQQIEIKYADLLKEFNKLMEENNA